MTLNVLIACEESQRVCAEFRRLGHRAFSCDIQEPSGGHPEWHILGDVIPLLHTNEIGATQFKTMDGTHHGFNGTWDLIIAHPPCTHLAVSGAAWFKKKRADGRQQQGIEFFCKFLETDCDRVVIENPVGIISGDYISKYFPDICTKYGLPKKPTQIIQPWQFGDNFNKTTCLWIKSVCPLTPIITEQLELEWFEWTDSKTGKKKRQPKWFADAWNMPAKRRAKVRSKTFPGIAKAMAEQWSAYLTGQR